MVASTIVGRVELLLGAEDRAAELLLDRGGFCLLEVDDGARDCSGQGLAELVVGSGRLLVVGLGSSDVGFGDAPDLLASQPCRALAAAALLRSFSPALPMIEHTEWWGHPARNP